MNKTKWQAESVREVMRRAGSQYDKVIEKAVDLSLAYRMTCINNPSYKPKYCENGVLYTPVEVEAYEQVKQAYKIGFSHLEYSPGGVCFRRKRVGFRWDRKYEVIVAIPNLKAESVLEKMARLGTEGQLRYSVEYAAELAEETFSRMLDKLDYTQEAALDLRITRAAINEYIQHLSRQIAEECPLVYLPKREEPTSYEKRTVEQKADRAFDFYCRIHEGREIEYAVRRVRWDFIKRCDKKNYWAAKLKGYGQEVEPADKLSTVLEKLAAEYRQRGE